MKIRQTVLILLSGIVILLSGFSAQALAGNIDFLIEQLHAKKILTEEEYQRLKSKEKEKKYPSVKMEGRMMLDYRDHSPDATTDLKSDTSPALDIRRARLGAKIALAKNIKGEIVLDIAEDGAELDTASMAYRFPNGTSLVFGKTKVGFSLEEMTSSRWIDFIERSLANTYGGVGKTPQVAFNGKIGDIGGFNLAYAAFDTKDEAEGKQLGLRATLNLGTKNESVYHLGVGLTQGDRVEGEVDRTYAGRGQKFFKASANIDTASGEYEHARQGLELAIVLGSFKAQYESIKTSYNGIESTTNAGVFDKDITTSYLNLMYMVTGEKYAKSYKTSSGKFDKIKPINGDKGAIEIGIRLSSFDASDWDTGNGPRTSTGYTSEADSTTYGLKWIPTTNVRFIINYQVTDYETAVTTVNGEKRERTWLTRAQFSF